MSYSKGFEQPMKAAHPRFFSDEGSEIDRSAMSRSNTDSSMVLSFEPSSNVTIERKGQPENENAGRCSTSAGTQAEISAEHP
jgi:hypothetical protein